MEKSVGCSAPWGMILFLIFLWLKLAGHIDWSWWWVSAPLWVPLLLVVATILLPLVILGLVAVAAFLWDVFDGFSSDRYNKRARRERNKRRRGN